KAPSGGPLVQHALLALLEMVKEGKLTLEQLVQKTAHNTATLFQIENRGYIREGVWADLVLVNLDQSYTVSKANILSKCGWSPFEGYKFSSSIIHTIVSGNIAYSDGEIKEIGTGHRLLFNR